MSDAPVLLRAERLHRTYQMGPVALRVLVDCALAVRAGEFVAVMGKSGSGKSTLLHVLGALDVPDRGQVHYDGQPVFAPEDQRRVRTGVFDALSPHERRRNRLRANAFGFVFQFYHLLPELNVLENVVLPRMVAAPTLAWRSVRRDAHDRALALLQRVGLGDRLKHRPAELSGGERQRVAIARALVHAPRVLLADEPTGNLDAQAGANILSILSEFHRAGQTIVMVTHDPGIARSADRVLQLDQGRLGA